MGKKSIRTKPKLVYVGNFKESFCTEVHVANSFEELGWRVIRIQEDEANAAEVIRKMRDAQFLLYTRTWDLPFMMDVFGEAKRLGIPTASFSLDLYIGIKREEDMGKSLIWRADYVFTADGGHQEEFKRKGINHFWISPGVYGKECVRGTPRIEYAQDIVFVGSKTHYHKEWPFRKNLIEWLQYTYGPAFKLWGDRETIRGKDLNDLYASAKIVVGDSLYSPRYWSDRITETLGRGGFLIAPIVEGIETQFKVGTHFVGYHYGDFEGLKAKIGYYLAHPKEREKIRRAGHEWVKAHHTYKEKCRQMLEIMNFHGNS